MPKEEHWLDYPLKSNVVSMSDVMIKNLIAEKTGDYRKSLVGK